MTPSLEPAVSRRRGVFDEDLDRGLVAPRPKRSVSLASSLMESVEAIRRVRKSNVNDSDQAVECYWLDLMEGCRDSWSEV